MGRRQGGTRDARGERPGSTSPVEWVVAAISAALVLGMIGFLGYEALGRAERMPEIAIESDTIVEVPSGYLVQFTARNSGNVTAAGVQVEGVLERDGQELEKAGATLDYLPAHGSEKGGLFFTNDPREGRLRFRPTGYQKP